MQTNKGPIPRWPENPMFLAESSNSTPSSPSSFESPLPSYSPGDVVYGFVEEKSWWRKAVILDTRTPMSLESGISATPSTEYYVHFFGMNRRHDRWLTFPSLSSELPLDSATAPGGYSDESDHEGMNEADIREWEKATKIKRIDKLLIGKHLVETWYWSPFPSEYQNFPQISICEFCLMFFAHFHELKLHSSVCRHRHPPGDEIYRDEASSVSVFEVDGYFERVYTENLCFISKCFLDHKRFDKFEVANFYFYIVGEWDVQGFHLVGYFSKEKQQTARNLSCIMLLPCYQRRGYGKFLIELSYELARITGRMGTPERPLSDLGKRTYLSFWLGRVVAFLGGGVSGPVSIQDISNGTGILPDDVKMALEDAGLIKYKNGQHVLIFTQAKLKQLVNDDKLKINDNPNHVKFNPDFLHWTPLNLPDPNASLGPVAGNPL